MIVLAAWRRWPYTRYGAASSPILVGDTVVVVQDQEEAHDDDRGWMGAFDRGTDKEVWRRTWDDTCCSYSTPMLWDRPGVGPELLFAYSGLVAAHDPATASGSGGTPTTCGRWSETW